MASTPLTIPQPRRFGRRTFMMGGATLAATLAFGPNRATIAARGWCRSDPLVQIGATLVYVVCMAPPDIRRKVSGPTEIVIAVPTDVKAKLISHGAGFGQGDTVTFFQDSSLDQTGSDLDVVIKVRVPASADLPVGVELAPRTAVSEDAAVSADGRTNTWIVLSTELEQEAKRVKRGRKR